MSFFFDVSFDKWRAAVQCLSVVDVLVSLSRASRHSEAEVCRPQFVAPSRDSKPLLVMREARHPCFSRTATGSDFIPNDVIIGVQDVRNLKLFFTYNFCNIDNLDWDYVLRTTMTSATRYVLSLLVPTWAASQHLCDRWRLLS